MKKFLKKFSALLTGICILAGTVFTEPIWADNSNSADLNYVQGKMYYSDLSSDGIDVCYATNLQQLLSGDNTVFNKDIAVTAEILASDIYGNVKVSTSGDSSNTNCTDDTSIYSRDFGLDDVQVVDLSKVEYTQDANDISRFAISHKLVNDNGTEKEIIVVVVEGTNGTFAQWSSNYDVGAGEDVYTGQHSEWIDHENHKGFDVTFRRVLAAVNSYISQNVSSSADKTILITGHSRGGAIANLLGNYFEDNPEYKSFTYTFAAPAVTTKTDVSADSVFNIINTDDVIPYFPLSSWGFRRYGTDISYNVADMTSQWKALTGIDYTVCSGSDISDKAGVLTSDRAGLYTINKETAAGTMNFSTADEANAKITEMKTALTNMGFTESYYTFEVTENAASKSNPYTVYGYISPAFLMQYLAGLASSSSPFSYMTQVVGILDCSKIKGYNAVASYMVYHYMNKSIVHAHCSYAYYISATGGEEYGIINTEDQASHTDDESEIKSNENDSYSIPEYTEDISGEEVKRTEEMTELNPENSQSAEKSGTQNIESTNTEKNSAEKAESASPAIQNSNRASTPSTGDENYVWLLLLMIALAAGITIAATLGRKKILRFICKKSN